MEKTRKAGDPFTEADIATGYVVRYEMDKNEQWLACPLRFIAAASEQTIDETRVKVAEAIQLYLENQRQHGWKIPDPEDPPEL